MKVLWFEFTLSLRRLFRRRIQNSLMLITFAVSVTLSLLSWTLFHTVHLSQPNFDPKGDYQVLAYEGVPVAAARQSSLEELETYKTAQTIFSDFAEIAFYYSTFIRTDAGQERVFGAFPSSRALQLVGAQPLMGRLFTPEDDVYLAPTTVLLSEKLWARGFGRDPDIVGKLINIDRQPATIVGVMPASFRFPNDQDIWISYGAVSKGTLSKRSRHPLRSALVRLQPGITKARAERDLQAIQSTMPPDSPSRIRKDRPALISYRDAFLVKDIRISSMILLALSLLFLAVSCANAANLMVIDFLGRRPEVAASLALGIPRGSAIRSVCWQVGIIALTAASIAIMVLPWAGPLLFDRVQSMNSPYWLVYNFAWHEAGMAFLFAGVSSAVTVIAPIVYLLLVDPDKVIRDHAYASRGTGRALWRRLLLTGQIALLTVLGVCAGLLLHSNSNMGESHWGYKADSVFTGKISIAAISYPKGQWSAGRMASLRLAFQGVSQRPETASAAFSDRAPGFSGNLYCTYATDPAALASGSTIGDAFYSRISDQYFETLGVPFVAGEDFPAEMPDDGPPYAIINESLAHKLWPNENPLRRTLHVRYPKTKPGKTTAQLVVRGVVRDFQANGPRARSNDAIFTPYRSDRGPGPDMTIFVRDKFGVPTVKSITDAMHGTESRAALYFPTTLTAQIKLILSSVRMTTHLTAVFAAAAVLLCAIGVYSLTVTQVLQSSREFGIRMALGAEPGRLWRSFTRGHLWTAVIGIALGLAGASQVVRVLASLLYGVDPYNAATYLFVALVILSVAALACIPSLFRLKRINPAECLRSL